ncbi:carbohydrate ABC transporter permease [Schaalia georgiae]|uniref:carbohydrate ABC transporter permease n=1 Tax=Schaalia georgiae TaxID=52768 RepID=UPI000402A4B4|nr:sugar ABC transporter permease [Schaalia georgiae]
MPTTRAERTRRHGAGAGAYLYVLPALALIAVTALYSIAANVVYSTWDWSGISDSHVGVGLRNYADLFHDRVFWKAIANTLVFGVSTVSLQMVLGFSLAVLVRTRARGRGVLRTLLFVPVVISPAIIATSFRVLLTPDGAFNQMLRGLGMTGFDHGWLTDPKTALATIIAINVWQYTGYSFVIYDAAISQIEPSIIEAARLDGLGALGMATRIVAPLVKGDPTWSSSSSASSAP